MGNDFSYWVTIRKAAVSFLMAAAAAWTVASVADPQPGEIVAAMAILTEGQVAISPEQVGEIAGLLGLTPEQRGWVIMGIGAIYAVLKCVKNIARNHPASPFYLHSAGEIAARVLGWLAPTKGG